MSNKSKGTEFEKFFGGILAHNGFWAHVLADNRNGQPFDVIATKDNVPYAFDCKECESDRFQLSRMEANQISAMERWIETGNDNAFFVIKFCKTYNIYVIPFKELNVRRLAGITSITEEAIKEISTAWF